MLRWLYIRFLWLHPPLFRSRFGDEMHDDFDRSGLRDKPRYFADALASLARQWLLRPEFRKQEEVAVIQGAPLFQTIETWKPRPVALLQGGLLALVSILATVALIPEGGGPSRFLIGVHFSSPGLLPVDRNSLAGSDLSATVKLGPDPFEPWLKLGRQYFASMPVLRALDADRDFALSPWEIAGAPAALRTLNTSHAGKLTPSQCGLHFDPRTVPSASVAELGRRFMSFHPVLAILDVDHDGEISPSEIDQAARALKKLDTNHDAYLTADELIPPEIAVRAGLR